MRGGVEVCAEAVRAAGMRGYPPVRGRKNLMGEKWPAALHADAVFSGIAFARQTCYTGSRIN